MTKKGARVCHPGRVTAVRSAVGVVYSATVANRTVVLVLVVNCLEHIDGIRIVSSGRTDHRAGWQTLGSTGPEPLCGGAGPDELSAASGPRYWSAGPNWS